MALQENAEWDWKLKQSSQLKQGAAANEDASDESSLGFPKMLVRLCEVRGLKTAESIYAFLNPKFELLTPALKIQDMDRAVNLLIHAREKGIKVRIFGDYDVDGTSGAALLGWVFREHHILFDIRQPDRFKDGYGLNVTAVEQAVQEGVELLLTIDCGITSFDSAKRAKELGVALVVVDHHQIDPERGIPEALAVVNPQRSDCPSGLRQVCGCGLAFYLAIALRALGREKGWYQSAQEPNLKQHLDLVALATAADMVSLTGDNHILIRYGLEVLKKSKKPGLKALLQVAGLSQKDLSPGHLGFVLGPRINASGRMQSASLACQLLMTQDEAEAFRLATEIERLNLERSELQNRIWDSVRSRVEQGIAQGYFKHSVVVGDPSWHEGVVGIVASKVTEHFHRPAAVLALRDDFGKGSVRSFGGKDVLAALRECSHLLIGFGGHRHAAGLSLNPAQLHLFAEAWDHALSKMSEHKQAKQLQLDGICDLSDFDAVTLQHLEKMGPFGTGNPEPLFAFKATVSHLQYIKGRHLKMLLTQSSSSAKIEALWFHAAERKNIPQLGEQYYWAGTPELNRFRGQVTPCVRIKDYKPADVVLTESLMEG